MMKYLVFVLLFISQFKLYAQNWLGFSNSNYAGTNALYLNPAHVSDSRNKLYINLVGNDFFIINNYLAYNAPYSFVGLATNTVADKYRSDRGLIVWKKEYYHERLNGKPKHLHAGGDARGPSVQYSFNNNKMAVGFSSRIRYGLSLTNVSEQTARLIRYGTDPIEFQTNYPDQHFTLNTDGLAEASATFGMVLKDNDEYFWKIGATIKRDVSFFNVHAQLQQADYDVQPVQGQPNREIIVADNTKGFYGYTTEQAFLVAKPNFSFLFGNAPAGSGWGFDIGVVYEYRPDFDKFVVSNAKKTGRVADPNRNKYKFRFSAALVDVGRMRFSNDNGIKSRHFDFNQNDVTFSYQNFNNINDTGKAVTAVNWAFGWNGLDNYISPFTIGLPTAVNMSLDYQIRPKVYLNTLWVQSLRNATSMSMKPQSVLALTPRYENRWWEVAMPIALIDNYSTISWGLAARAGVLVVGTDHLGGLLNIGKPRGTDFYFSLNIPIAHAKPKASNDCFYPPYERKFNK